MKTKEKLQNVENMIIMMMLMMIPGVSGEEDQRSGQRAAVCHEGPEESHTER